jgi:hypothetical protein
MPHGCGLWPAYWSTGSEWPNDGEIDVVEGVNNQSTNQMTLHTSAGCRLATRGNDYRRDVAFTGKVFGTQCESSDANNNGCGVGDTDDTSFGHWFNMQAGGVWAHRWDSTGITIWRFSRNDIPEDIQARTPNPDSWPTPVAEFSSEGCDMGHFRDHSLILDTTICGDWAGASFSEMGCGNSCQDVVGDPGNFHCEF